MEQQCWSKASGRADGGSELEHSWSSDSADSGQRCLANIWRISALYPTKRTNKHFLLSWTNKDFSNSTALCFTETWLNDATPDSALHLPSFRLIRSDRDAESTGKSSGGGTCFYIFERWCTDVTVLKKMCCPDLEALFINCKPCYSPWEFCSFILVSVYIPALQKLADQITDTEQQHRTLF